jgi:hypothetical protein
LSAAPHKQAVRVAFGLVAAGVLAVAPARGAEMTRVVTAPDDQSRVDFNLSLAWQHDVKSAFIKRESESDTPPGIDLLKDSKYNRTRDVIDLRGDIGILWDVGLHVDLPLVLSDVETIGFDQSASPCTFPGMGGTPTCVDASNSTLLRDGILPSNPPNGMRQAGMAPTSYGIDAQHGGRAFPAPAPGMHAPDLFQGPQRRGIQDLGAGINWAVFNQARDDTKPTWILAFDARLDLFSDMRFDPANAGGNTAVGPGYHQFIWSTMVSKRIRRFDPYFGAWYDLPVRTTSSIYQQFSGGNQGAVNPQQSAGVVFGFEQIAWENARGDQRVTLEARGRAEEHFFGVSASELWQPLSGHPGCVLDGQGPTGCRPGIDEVEYTNGRQPAPYPGVTETQAYGTFGGDVGLNVQVGRFVRFRGLFGLTLDMPHLITDASPGVDRNKNGRVDSMVPPNDPSGAPYEANPVYRETVDIPGRRFKVEGTQVWSLFLEGSIMF